MIDPPALPPRRDITTYGAASVDPPAPAYPQGRPTSGDSEVRLEEVWGLASRNRWLILAVLLVALGAAAVHNHMSTRIYEAWTTIRVEDPETNPISNEPTLALGSDETIETEMEVLRSFSFAEMVVDSLDLQVQVTEPERLLRAALLHDIRVARDAPAGSYVLGRSSDGFSVSMEEGAPLDEIGIGEEVALPGVVFRLTPEAAELDRIAFRVLSFEAAVGSTRASLVVNQVDPNIRMIRLSSRGPDRGLTADIANAYAEIFIAQRGREHKTEASSTVAFLEEQIDSLALHLSVAEDDLREFQEAEQIVNLPAEGTAQIGQAAQLQAERDVLESQRAALARILRDVESGDTAAGEVSPYRRLIASPSLMSGTASSQLISSLVQLENEKGELLTRRQTTDPDVQALDERIGQIERQLHSIASTQHQSLSGQIASLNASLGRETGSLAEMPRKQVEMARRERETALLQEVYTLLQTRLKEAEIAQAVEDPSARIVDRADVRSGPIEPQSQRNLLMALVVGLALGFGSAYLREHLDKTVHSKADVQLLTGVPVLGLVPRFEEGEGNGRGSLLTRMLPGKGGNGSPRARGRALVQRDPRSVVNEAFRTLRTNINFAAAEDLPRTLLLTSALPRDGKTTTSVNLAHAFAHQGLRVLVVDADMRRGTIHQMFQIGRDPGLSNVLVGDGRVEDAIREVETAPGVELHVLTTGTIPPNPTELLASARMRWLVEHLAQQYDQVILDSPPLTLVADAAVLAPHMDSVLVVVRAGYTEEAALTYTMDQLRHVGAPVRGTILNDVDVRDRRYGGYQYYGYRYDYYSAEDSAG